jgi:hypothetical protein
MPYLIIALLFSARPVDSIAEHTLTLALQRSAVVRTLVDALERSNVVIHIQASRDLPFGIAGTTRFVVARGGYRYLRITIAATLPEESRMAVLAHELQHANEIAGSPASDVKSLERLFQQCGMKDGNYYETRAAQHIEKLVRAELLAGSYRPSQ